MKYEVFKMIENFINTLALKTLVLRLSMKCLLVLNDWKYIFVPYVIGDHDCFKKF